MFYLAPFDVTEIDFGTLTIATAGKPDVVITLSALTAASGDGTSSIFFHYPATTGAMAITSEDSAAAARLTNISNYGFGLILKLAIQNAASGSGWSSVSFMTLAWQRTTAPYGYAMTYPAANFSMTWSNAAGRALMGFSANQTGSNSYTATLSPTYLINPTLTATTDHSPSFEPAAIGNHVVSDSGHGYGISRYISPLYRDWLQQFETAAKTERLDAAASHPWTFQHLFEYCRGARPFMVLDGFGKTYYELFSFRSEGIPWGSARASVGDGTHFHIQFRTVIEGSIATGL